ncbi:cold-shock protein [Bacillus atrophaeus]
MSYYNKRNQEPLPQEEVTTCTKEDCNGWTRKNFASSDTPECPLCGSKMIDGVRTLVNLQNNSQTKTS